MAVTASRKVNTKSQHDDAAKSDPESVGSLYGEYTENIYIYMYACVYRPKCAQQTHTHTHTHTYSLSLSLSLSHTHVHAQTHTHAHAHRIPVRIPRVEWRDLQHLLGATERAFSARSFRPLCLGICNFSKIFWNSDYRQRLPLKSTDI